MEASKDSLGATIDRRAPHGGGLLLTILRIASAFSQLPDEAHRRADDEFAAAGLLVTGSERTLPTGQAHTC